MFKFLLKLAVVGIVVYGLVQIPFFNKYVQEMRASIMEKVQNVTNEADRIQGKIDGVKKTIDDTKEKVTGVADALKETGEKVEDTFTTINKTADALKEAIQTDPKTSEPGYNAPSATAETQTTTTTK